MELLHRHIRDPYSEYLYSLRQGGGPPDHISFFDVAATNTTQPCPPAPGRVQGMGTGPQAGLPVMGGRATRPGMCTKTNTVAALLSQDV